MTTDTETSFEPSMMKVIGYDMAKEAARQVYEEAGIGPDDVAVVGLHDWFTANELVTRSEEHTSELQSLMRISYAVFCLTKKRNNHGYLYDCKGLNKSTFTNTNMTQHGSYTLRQTSILYSTYLIPHI